MDVELLVTGDELVRGAIADTNSPWLLERLASRGARVRRVVTVGDDRAELLTTMREASSRCDVVVVSGGLGPTSDDLTAEVSAELAGVPLVSHHPTLTRLEARWVKRGRALPAGARKQALVPAGAEVLDNDEGTAPGFSLQVGRARVFFFAGVPREFRHLSERHLLPFVASRSDGASATRTLRCVALTESEVDAALAPIARRTGARLGLRAIFPESWASLTLRADTLAQAQAALGPVVEEACRVLGLGCYSSEDETLEQVVGGLLSRRGETVSVAESCTGGLLGGALTAVVGSSAWFEGGVIAYAYGEKERALGVPEAMLAEHGAVSEPVARAMAIGARDRLGTTWALSITGVAGPGGGTEHKPVGTVWLALAGPAGVTTLLLQSTRSDRESIRRQSVTVALDLLRRALLEAAA